MTRKWADLAAKQRAEVLDTLRTDYETWRDAHPAGDEYPGESSFRAEALAAAIRELGGTLDWPKE